eukprot:TRINITY_DN6485_c0_g1_i1.p1 TRINITY_DN6485_c0_g1~~TRINITY_DN6485_c0_g1_i1.p1  ORF type:complete len:157 (-),score=15.35 TRINITY_DN6485_c0_g1_i1:74-544(-)
MQDTPMEEKNPYAMLDNPSSSSYSDRYKTQFIDIVGNSDLLKFNRIGTHLANERTLLAWVRTACSLFALAVAFLKIEIIYDLMLGMFILFMSMVTFVVGMVRYYQVKIVLERPGEAGFNRLGLRYYIGILLLCFTAVIIYRGYTAVDLFVELDGSS